MLEKIQGLSRRAAIATGAAAVSGLLAPKASAANEAIADVIKIAEEKNAAFMVGDMDRWVKLVRFAPDFTLMQPFGGPASHGFEASPEKLAALSRYFRGGKATLEVAQTYGGDNLAILVMIERQSGEVGGLPEQDWSLRVTEVYRKDAGEWHLVHRHADPLVHRFSLEQTAALARGQLADG